VAFGEDLLEKDGNSFIMINKEKSRDIMLKSGKLLSEHAPIYMMHLFLATCFTQSNYDFRKPFSKSIRKLF